MTNLDVIFFFRLAGGKIKTMRIITAIFLCDCQSRANDGEIVNGRRIKETRKISALIDVHSAQIQVKVRHVKMENDETNQQYLFNFNCD